uniref:Uncharacterized protein n=1 Tax=Cryptomonas curvata TaxID=233186 RepID=A0A7S0M7G4_9CRYP|mmetsp:Transcript_28274/g.59043  ORF Transcript_28274/g.59043 Transcript_28274/m.59043 type:complete len:126 (+) Transcript_28274:139-516(+)
MSAIKDYNCKPEVHGREDLRLTSPDSLASVCAEKSAADKENKKLSAGVSLQSATSMVRCKVYSAVRHSSSAFCAVHLLLLRRVKLAGSPWLCHGPIFLLLIPREHPILEEQFGCSFAIYKYPQSF